jgi:hypothetical protein
MHHVYNTFCRMQPGFDKFRGYSTVLEVGSRKQYLHHHVLSETTTGKGAASELLQVPGL